jgi:hypothetical protein
MRKELWIIPVILLITASCSGYYSSPEVGYPPSGGSYADPGVQSYPGNPQEYGQYEDTSYFYDRLSPYGNWIDYNPYGYVWIPRHMRYGWRPYSDGRWVWTDYGWTWIADQEWGDIPFHYGRWGYDNQIGWFWVPGTVWGPAWVTWRSNDQYMGWAPLPPGVEFGVGMDFNTRAFDIPLHFWVFIQGRHFQDRYVNPYILPYERNVTIINYTNITNNIYVRNDRIVNEGIGLDNVRRFTGRDVAKYGVRDTRQPGRAKIVGQEVQISRPTIRIKEGAKPKVFMNKIEAERELTPARVFDPQGPQTIQREAAAVQKRQNEELRILRQSQVQEIKSMQIKRDSEVRTLRGASEKAKLRRDYEARILDLKKNHNLEKQKMKNRHNTDAEQVKRIKKSPQVKKKQDNQQ